MIRVHLLKLLTILISGIFFIKIFSLQVLDKDYYKLSQNNAILELEDYPERGFIFDRKGKVLVSNQPAYDIIPCNSVSKDSFTFLISYIVPCNFFFTIIIGLADYDAEKCHEGLDPHL